MIHRLISFLFSRLTKTSQQPPRFKTQAAAEFQHPSDDRSPWPAPVGMPHPAADLVASGRSGLVRRRVVALSGSCQAPAAVAGGA